MSTCDSVNWLGYRCKLTHAHTLHESQNYRWSDPETNNSEGNRVCGRNHPDRANVRCSLERGHSCDHAAYKQHQITASSLMYTWQRGMMSGEIAESEAPSNEPIEVDMATIKSYQISKLREIVDDYHAALDELDEAIEVFNANEIAAAKERSIAYLTDGVYTNRKGDEVDESTTSFQERQQNLIKSAFAPVQEANSWRRQERLATELNALEGDVVDLDPDEARSYLALKENAAKVRTKAEQLN